MRTDKVVPTSNADIIAAGKMDMKDFEDALQCAAAQACQASVIVTRNLDDYRNAPVPAMLAEDIVGQLTQ